MPRTGLSSADRRRSTRRGLAAVCALGGGLALLPTSAAAVEYQSASGQRDAGGPRVSTAMSSAQLFFDHRRQVSFFFRVSHSEPVTAVTTLVRPSSGEVLKRWRTVVEDDGEQVVRWNGLVKKRLQDEKKYAFRMVARGSDGATAHSASSSDTARDTFKLRHHRFPVRGKHQYWDGFGAGRNHQGTDVGAKCGARLQAARGGRVQYAGYHSAAGHYLVIDNRKTRLDFAYMHLKRRPRLAEGDRVRTGQRIGKVGESGNASGCHLHFEMWSAPGWYEGGRAIDSEPHLRRWDRYS